MKQTVAQQHHWVFVQLVLELSCDEGEGVRQHPGASPGLLLVISSLPCLLLKEKLGSPC